MKAGIDLDAAVGHLRTADEVMPRVIDAVGAPDLREPSPTPFQSLARSIIFQQLSGKAAGTILTRFVALFGDADDPLHGFFPTPEQVLAADEETLRSAGVSRQKAAALHDLAAHFAESELDSDQFANWDDAQIIANLTKVRGVGLWTAQMFLMFQLLRPDVLPTGDAGLNRAIQRLYGLDAPPKPPQVEELGAPWHPWATIACWYLWRSEDIPLELWGSA